MSEYHLGLARQIKAAAVASEGRRPARSQPVGEWYVDAYRHHKNNVSYEDISDNADKEYLRFLRVHPRIDYSLTMKENLFEWIKGVSDFELASRLSEIPSGVGVDGSRDFNFTKFQLLSLSTWIDLPFDVSASIDISVAKRPGEDVAPLHAIAGYSLMEKRRQTSITSSFAMLKGSCPDLTLVDIQTAGGKTAWTLAATALLLSPGRWEALLAELRNKREGTIFAGTPEMPVARLVIVAAAGSTFSHFKDTAERSIKRWKRKWPKLNFLLWEGYKPNQYSVDRAASVPRDTAVVWVLPIARRSKDVLKAHPTVTVAAMIWDEFTYETPRTRGYETNSTVVKNLIAQATPQALVKATSGNRSWLKEALGGQLNAPCDISGLVRNRSFSQAQLACDQACKLGLMTLTAFRPLIREDLKPLMPNGMDIYFVKSAFSTMAASILGTQVDMVPADFCNVLLSHFRSFYLTDESKEAIRRVTADGAVSINALSAVVSGLVSKIDNKQDATAAAAARIGERFADFTEGCPICMVTEQATFEIMGCCGYVVCGGCASRLRNCAFCRKEIPALIPRSHVHEDPPSAEPEAGPSDQDPRHRLARATGLPAPPDFATDATFGVNLRAAANVHMRQRDNFVNSLHTLMEHGYKRLLIVVECHTYGSFDDASSAQAGSDVLNPMLLSSVTGYDVQRVDGLFGGQAKEFEKLKRRFDNPATPPMALMSYGINERFVVGTDLGFTDALVVVGSIPDDLITQTLGRVFRPVPNCTSRRPLKIIKIYSGRSRSLMRTRPRGYDDDDDDS